MLLERKQIAWAVLASVLVVGVPSTSQAFFDWLCPCNWFRRPATTYAPVSTANYAPAPSTCAPTTTYMPVTAYRTVYQPTAVTAYQPVSSGCGLFGCCGLFGRPTTTYRPVTSVAYRPAVVPYTTYRPVTALRAPITCDPCAAPATTTYRGAASYTSTISTCPTSDCGAPVTREYPTTKTVPSTKPQTFEENGGQQTYRSQQSEESTQPQQNGNGLKPQPEASTGPRFMQPELIRPSASPASQGSIRQTAYYRPVSVPAPSAKADKPKVDVSGWRGARD